MNSIKPRLLLFSIFLLFLNACGDGGTGNKNAIMMDKLDDPEAVTAQVLQSMLSKESIELAQKVLGNTVKVYEYQHCMQNVSDKNFAERVKALSDQAAGASPINNIKKIELVDDCPLPAIAKCEGGLGNEGYINYYYVEFTQMLDRLKDSCYEGKWRVTGTTVEDDSSTEEAANFDINELENAVADQMMSNFAAAYGVKDVNDKKSALAAVKKEGSVLELLGDALKKDKQVVLAAVTQHGEAIQHADASLKEDKEVVLAALKQDEALALFIEIDESLKDDPEIIEAS